MEKPTFGLGTQEMDPLTAAGTYTTIVGLVCAYKNEKRAGEDQNREAFLAWLQTQRHEDLKEFILCTAELPSEIDLLLKEDTETILRRLNELRDSVVSLPTRIDHLKELVTAAQPRSERLALLPHLISEAEKAVRQIEKSALILLRTDTEKEWDVPMDVETLKEVYEQFRTIHIDDTLHHTFVVKECAFERESITIHREGRLKERDRLLKAMSRLIALREELDYLEQETRTQRR